MLEELYQQVILDHSRSPRNAALLENPSHQAHGHNPLCGDECWCTLQWFGATLENIGIKASGCAISVASASLLSECVQHKTLTEIEDLFKAFHLLVTTGVETETVDLGKCAVFKGVQQFPMRVKCATLAWHTLKAALEQRVHASTEQTNE